MVWPILAKRTQCRKTASGHFGETNPIPSTRSSPRKRGPMIIGQCSWVPALAALGRDDDGRAGFGETNPMPKNRLGSFWRNEPNPLNPVVPAKAGTHDHRPVFMGPGSRCARPGRRWSGRFWRNEPNAEKKRLGSFWRNEPNPLNPVVP